jgi:RNA polymerase sigma factor (sigma-70 family)
MSGRVFFEENLEAIDRAIARVCREMRLDGANAEDFASSVRLALLANDGAILQKFEGRSSLPTYLTIVARRIFYDQRRASGRFYASAEAHRRGPAAVELERLIVHERHSFNDAAEIVRREHPEVTPHELDEVIAALPDRMPRAFFVPAVEGDEDRFASGSTAADRVEAFDAARRSMQTNDAVRTAMETMTAEDRLILRLRFTANASIANIARSLGLEQRPLYRRIEALLVRLRRALEASGVDAEFVNDLIGSVNENLDFGLERKNGSMHPSPEEERR